MELLLILIYVSICYVVFKLFRIPVNQWSLATAALGGIVGIALLLLIMNYNHPFTKNARIYFAVTPVLPTVKGRVVEVPVKENAPLKEGDVLFRIDPKPYEYVVEQKKAVSEVPDVDPALRRANVMIRGLDLEKSRGKKLILGDCVINIRGENPPCRLMQQMQQPLRPHWRAGVFGEIVRGGTIRVGDRVAFEGL